MKEPGIKGGGGRWVGKEQNASWLQEQSPCCMKMTFGGILMFWYRHSKHAYEDGKGSCKMPPALFLSSHDLKQT